MIEGIRVEYWKKATIVMGIGSLTDGADFQVLIYAVPLLIRLWQLGPFQVAWITTAGTLGALIGSLVNGWLIDRFGRKRMWVIGNFAGGLFYLIGTLSSSFEQLLIARFLMGWSINATTLSFYSLMPEETPQDKRAFVSYLALVLNTAGIFTISTFLALTAVFPWINWQFLLAFVGTIDIIAALIGAMVLREPPRYLERKEKAEKGIGYKALVLSKDVRGIILGATIIGLCYGSYSFPAVSSGMVTYYETTVLKFSASTIGILGMISTVIAPLLGLIVGRLSDTIGRLNTMIGASVVGIVGLVGLWNLHLIGTGEQMAILSLFIVFLAASSYYIGGTDALRRLWFSEIMPTEARGSAQGYLGFLSSIVMTIGTQATAAVAVMFGPSGYMVIPFIAAIIGAITVLWAKKAGLETARKEIK